MRIADFLILTLMSAVMITGTSLLIDDVSQTYPSTMNVSQMDVMNITAVENSANSFEADIRATQNSSNFVSGILNGIVTSGSLVLLTMTATDQLVTLSANIFGSIFGIADPNGTISGLLTGMIVMLIALLIISIPFRWELTR